jgi:hypothetical protein
VAEIKRKHVSLHIEKTGGLTVKKFLVNLYDPKRVYFYSSVAGGFYRSDNTRSMFKIAPINPIADKIVAYAVYLNRNLPTERFLTSAAMYGDKGVIKASQLPSNWIATHGHFNSDLFESLTENPFRTVVLRDPLERMISHYADWKQSRGFTNWRVNIAFDTEITFRDFACMSELNNFQSKVLGKIPIEKFDVVGTTKNLDRFFQNVALRRKLSPIKFRSEHFNQTVGKPDRSKLNIDAFFLKKFKSLNEEDYVNYRKAKSMSEKASH